MNKLTIASGNHQALASYLRNSKLQEAVNARANEAAKDSNPVEGFTETLAEHVDSVNEVMKQSDASAEAFLKGEETSIHEVMIAMSKADVSFKLMTQIGRKVIEAYQEINRMQV